MMETADKGKYLSEMLCQSQGESLTRFVGRIPVELGEFHIEERASRQGISVADWRMQWNSDIRVKKGGQEGRDMVQLGFFVNHGMAWEMEGRKAPVCMRQGEICLYRDRALGSEGEYEGGLSAYLQECADPDRTFPAGDRGMHGRKSIQGSSGDDGSNSQNQGHTTNKEAFHGIERNRQIFKGPV